ncbi:MAG: hypothetical protein LBB79_03900 [Prevotellaceae bacterium]|jgi:magnesium-transporting ATPase (P-type)|nr:hypothetical protein [Prevotellaceae bacterium]
MNINLADSIKEAGDGKQEMSEREMMIERDRVNIDLRREVLESNKQDRQERKKFANKIFWLLVVFLTVVMAIVFLSGFCAMKLPSTVMVTLLATTSANVIGIFIFVVKYLFKTNSTA